MFLNLLLIASGLILVDEPAASAKALGGALLSASILNTLASLEKQSIYKEIS
jgi:hypothetical protein